MIKLKHVGVYYLFACSVAFAGTEKVTMQVDIMGSTNSYAAKKGEANTYEQSASRRVSYLAVKGTGALSAVSQQSPREISTDVPGVGSEPGHSILELKQNARDSKKLFVLVDKELQVEEDGISIKVPVSISVPAIFTVGSWESYEAGEDVEFVLSADGEETQSKVVEAKIKKALGQVRSVLGEQLVGFDLGQITVDEFRTSGRTVFTGNKNNLNSESVSVELTMSFTVSGPF